jgi:hypothetical protein
LGRAGLDLADVRAILVEQAANANTPRERSREIGGLIKGLARKHQI